MPTVSIIIPVHNRQRVLAETLDSCLAQSFADIEVIAVDDGSTDDSCAILDTYAAKDARVRVFKSLNMGQCVARNIGASMAHGEWLWFLDSDDLLLPKAVETMLQTVVDAKVTMGLCLPEGFWDGQQEAVRDRILAQTPDPVQTNGLWGYWPNQGFSFNTVLMTRDLFLKVGGFQPALRACEEMNLMLRLLLREPNLQVADHPIRLVLKRLDENSLACQARRSGISWQLVSLNHSADLYLANPTLGSPEVRRYLFDQLYTSMAFAHRNGQTGLALQGLAKWRQAQLPIPKLHPAYHHTLHRWLGFRKAEGLLALARKVLRR